MNAKTENRNEIFNAISISRFASLLFPGSTIALSIFKQTKPMHIDIILV